MDNNQDQFISISAGARHLGVSEMFLRRRCRDSWDGLKLPFYRIGGVNGRLRFRKSELTAYMQSFEGICGSKPVTTAE